MIKNKGTKNDIGKIRVELIPSQFIMEIGKALTVGAEKYNTHDWRNGLEWSRIYGAAMRHLLAWNEGKNIDPESGLSHLTHAATNILFLMEYENTQKDKDDRYIIKKNKSNEWMKKEKTLEGLEKIKNSKIKICKNYFNKYTVCLIEKKVKKSEFFRIGAKVKKVNGYNFNGINLGHFITTAGKTRYVIELEGSGGMLHIFRPKDLEIRN